MSQCTSPSIIIFFHSFFNLVQVSCFCLCGDLIFELAVLHLIVVLSKPHHYLCFNLGPYLRYRLVLAARHQLSWSQLPISRQHWMRGCLNFIIKYLSVLPWFCPSQTNFIESKNCGNKSCHVCLNDEGHSQGVTPRRPAESSKKLVKSKNLIKKLSHVL